MYHFVTSLFLKDFFEAVTFFIPCYTNLCLTQKINLGYRYKKDTIV